MPNVRICNRVAPVATARQVENAVAGDMTVSISLNYTKDSIVNAADTPLQSWHTIKKTEF